MKKSAQAQKICAHIEEIYNTPAEYLFESHDTAVFRKGERKKWFAVVMRISRKKLSINSDEMVYVLNVKLNPNEVALIVDHKGYFPAYHMNKKHWCTIVLDDTLSFEEIFDAIGKSFNLVKG